MPRPKRICWCTPTCGKKLMSETRRKHYNNLSPTKLEERGRSQTPPPSDSSPERPPLDFLDQDQNDSSDGETSADDQPPLPIPMDPDVSMASNFSQYLVHSPSNATQDVLDLSQDISMLTLASSDSTSDNEAAASGSEVSGEFDEAPATLDESFLPLDDGEIASEEDGQELPGLVEVDSNSEDDDTERWRDEEEDFGDPEEPEFESFNEAEELAIFMDEQQRLKAFEEMVDQVDNSGISYDRVAELSAQDIDDIQAFKLRLLATMPRSVFNEMRHCFRHKLKISSPYVIAHKVALLSGIQPKYIDCCISSCVAYTRGYETLTACPLCNQPRYDQSGNARKTFCYIPLIPRLQQFFLNPITRDELMYRHQYPPSSDMIADVFDGEHYRQLMQTAVTVDGKSLGHTFFSDPRDIAFTTCMDSYLLYGKHKCSGPSAMPILIQLYNLKPQIRIHLERFLCLGFVPGPRAPKDLPSFLAPFEDERVQLARGVRTYDVVEKEEFSLHAYDILAEGDIIAVEKFLNIKGHNAKRPCRSCEVLAVNNPGKGKKKTYYVPLTNADIDPAHLPLRKHSDWQATTERIQNALTQKARDSIAMATGIKGMPALYRVNSLDYARGIPWDFMHLLFENVVKNLVRLWMGKFKGLDEGTGSYIIPDHVWVQIGLETVEATKTIPSAFVRSLRNIFLDQGNYNAEAWSFWFMYIAPHLLKDRFKDGKYYKHFIELVDIMQTCMQFSISHDDLKVLEQSIISWVQDYERFYYQNDIDRLSVCTLTIHGLLHISDNIRFCGPVWTTWTFWMERFCGYMQAGLRSHVHPWADLRNRILHKAYLDQIEIYYRLDETFNQRDDSQKEKEEWMTQYEHVILKPPVSKKFQPDVGLLSKVAEYFAQVLGCPKAHVHKLLPSTMPFWGRLEIVNSGGSDTIRSAAAYRTSDVQRDMSFIRYEVEYDTPGLRTTSRTINYGQLIRILQCHLDSSQVWGSLKNTTCLLALIEPCQTHGKDATSALVSYDRQLATLVTDLRNVHCVIGRVLRGKKWGIIDRSGPIARTTFAPAVLGEEHVVEDEATVD